MSKIVFIPIDNRPVCYELPKLIINQAKEHELFMPDKKLLGSLIKNADIKGILDWLSTLNNMDIAIISLDTIAYGGLISSRRTSDSYSVIKERIDKLIDILNRKSIKVFAFSSIMRISNNNINEEEKDYWSLYGKKIFEYSYNLDKEGFSDTLGISDDVIKDYIETRERNFEINKYYIELKKQNIFDTLVFSKDDCAKYGLNVKEARELKILSEGIEGIYVKTGADEIPLSLLSRAVNRNKKIKIAPVYTNPNSIEKISKYEDISVKESVKSQIELTGGIVSTESDCDLIMLVNNFKNEQGELVMGVEEPLYKGDLKLTDKPFFAVDILNANGADNNFAKAVLKQDFKSFYGYSAWNTTGNSLGGGLSAALTYFKSVKPDNSAFKKLQTVRFLDDWAYQANVRSLIRNDFQNLTNGRINEEMRKFEQIIFNKFGLKNPKIKYLFPWNRFFEIDIILCE